MAGPRRRKSAALIEQLLAEPQRFQFEQAVRLLERLARENRARDLRGVGQEHGPEHEAVRFRSFVGLMFPAADITSIKRRDEPFAPPGSHELTVAFMGLTGPDGALPEFYTRLLLSRLRMRDTSLRDFLDAFFHRQLSLYYRTWCKYRPAITYEQSLDQPPHAETRDIATLAIQCLVGLGHEALRQRSQFPDETLLYFSGALSNHTRNATMLEQVLAEYTQAPVEVQQFQGQWLRLESDDRVQLCRGAARDGECGRLGLGVNLGERVWSVDTKFRITLGPLSHEQFRSFLPSGSRLRPLNELIRTYVGPEFDFDIQMILRADEVPPSRLAPRLASRRAQPAEIEPSRIGWNAWLCSRPAPQDMNQAVFTGRPLPVR